MFFDIKRQIITFESGNIGMKVFVNGDLYATLISDLVPKNKAEINNFISLVSGETTVTKPEDYEPLNKDTIRTQV